MRTEEISPLSLAFVGDAVYTLLVRQTLAREADYPVKEMTERAKKFVSAKAQAEALAYLEEAGFLTEEERDIARRGRNARVRSHAKNVQIAAYHQATGLEALIGWLYMRGDLSRIGQIWDAVRRKEEQRDGSMDIR